MFHHLYRFSSISLSLNFAIVLPRQDVSRVNCLSKTFAANYTNCSLNSNNQNLQRRLLGSLILLAPYAFVSQCQNSQENSLRHRFSFIDRQISLLLIKFKTPEIYSRINFISMCSKVRLQNFIKILKNHLQTFYAQSIRITLVPLVLPRLLARSKPGLRRQVQS